VASSVERAVLCPPPAIYKVGAHGVTRPTLDGPQGRGDRLAKIYFLIPKNASSARVPSAFQILITS
jgi:hypothetical protein